MNRTVEMEPVSPVRSRPQDSLAPSRPDRGQGDAFRSSLQAAGAESAGASEAPLKADPEDDSAAMPYMVAWAPSPSETEAPAAGEPDIEPLSGTDAIIVDTSKAALPVDDARPTSAAPENVPAPELVADEDIATQATEPPAAGAEAVPAEAASKAAPANSPDADLKTATSDAPVEVSAQATELMPDMSGGEQDQAGSNGTQTIAEPSRPADTDTRADLDPEPVPTPAPDTAVSLAQATETAASDTATKPESQTQSAQSLVTGVSAPATAAPAPATTPTTSTTFTPAPGQAVITASPAELVSVVTETLSNGEDKQDRIVVQLDPPELGRVSIDFKIDAQGVQHITVTGETPEALRQLRAMHFELIQSLERQGISAGDMTFRQEQQSDGQQSQSSAASSNTTEEPNTTAQTAAPRLVSPPSRNIQPPSVAGGLNIRL